MPPPWQTGGWRHVLNSSVCYQTCGHNNLKTNEPIVIPTGSAQVIHGPRAWNDQLLGQEVKGQYNTRPKKDLEAGGGMVLDPPRTE